MSDRHAAEDLARLREFLNAWDPHSLISGGAPEDEFDSERGEIYQALRSGGIASETELASRIAAIFRRAFDSSFTPENCADLAESIWTWWEERTSEQP